MPTTHFYTLTLDPASQAGQNGRFGEGVWRNTANSNSSPDTAPYSVRIGDRIIVRVKRASSTFENFRVYDGYVVFSPKRSNDNSRRSSPITVEGRPRSVLVSRTTPDMDASELLIIDQIVDTKGAFEFTVALLIDLGPLNNGENYSRDPELDVTD